MRVTFNELATRELNDAAQYYEHEQAGLGASFISEVERCTREVLSFPQAGTSVHGSIRRRLCQRFPYGLLYSVVGDEIRILAVMESEEAPTIDLPQLA